MAHWLGAAWLFQTVVTFGGEKMKWPMIAIIVVLAAIKEFVIDLNTKWESPEESGGFWGSVEDFLSYMLGLGIGNLVIHYQCIHWIGFR